MPISTYISKNNTFEWIDIAHPELEELKPISEKYALPHYALLDCLEPDHLPKFEELEHAHFFIFRLYALDATLKTFTVQELTHKIAVFYGENFIVTIHRREFDFLTEILEKYVETNICTHPSEIATKILWYGLNTYYKPVSELGDGIDNYEKNIFLEADNSLSIGNLYFLKRKANLCRKMLTLSLDILNRHKITKHDKSAMQDVKDLHLKLTHFYDQIVESANNLMNIYLSLASQKTNEVMKVLTIFSAFFMPITFIVGVYGMNFKYLPELEYHYGYPIAMFSMVIISLIIYFWFRRKKWM